MPELASVSFLGSVWHIGLELSHTFTHETVQCVGRNESLHFTDEVELPRIIQLMTWVSGREGMGLAGSLEV